jgi:hypothetical protein
MSSVPRRVLEHVCSVRILPFNLQLKVPTTAVTTVESLRVYIYECEGIFPEDVRIFSAEGTLLDDKQSVLAKDVSFYVIPLDSVKSCKTVNWYDVDAVKKTRL